MGYRARVEPPTPAAYVEIFRRAAFTRGLRVEQPILDYVLNNYMLEHRQMKACEPRDLLDRAVDICLFEGIPIELTPKLIDGAWRNYFGTSHGFNGQEPERRATSELRDTGRLHQSGQTNETSARQSGELRPPTRHTSDLNAPKEHTDVDPLQI